MESKGYYDVLDGRIVWVFFRDEAPDIAPETVLTEMGRLDVVTRDRIIQNEDGSRLDLERPTTAVSSVG